MNSNYTIISETDFQKARNEIKKARETGKKIVFSGDDELNRKVLEKEKIDILLVKLVKRKDRLKQRDSGFNQVLAKLAQKGKVAIGINLDEIIKADKKEKAKIIARLVQNVKLCNKNKLKMKFISSDNSKDIYDLVSLGSVLGMPTWMLNNSI
ncbi:MAG: RNase P subunit p30 family protein [Candidatus Pacearchaeota archaeon]